IMRALLHPTLVDHVAKRMIVSLGNSGADVPATYAHQHPVNVDRPNPVLQWDLVDRCHCGNPSAPRMSCWACAYPASRAFVMTCARASANICRRCSGLLNMCSPTHVEHIMLPVAPSGEPFVTHTTLTTSPSCTRPRTSHSLRFVGTLVKS